MSVWRTESLIEMSAKQNKWMVIVCVIGIIAIGEIMLRVIWGFADAPLYEASNEWEYMARPNQDGYRFGHHYHYNSYRQRSEEPDSTKTIILGLGDSVLLGGVMTEQDSTASYIFNQMTGMQMLNISAGSWGPDNCAAYLKHYGTFGAKAMFLLVSSHDAHDNMDFQPVVGHYVSYPDKQYWSAWAELFCRYIWPRTIEKLFSNSSKKDPDQKVVSNIGGIQKSGKHFNPGFSQLKEISDSLNIPLLVCLHPEIGELEAGEYNEQGQEIIIWAEKNNVKLIKEIEEGITKEMFRDGIHTNEKGQRFEAEIMVKYLYKANMIEK